MSCQQVGIWTNTATTLASTIAWAIVPLANEVFEADEEVSAVIMVCLTTVLAISFAVTARYAYLCTVAIPTDILVSKQREVKQLGEAFVPVWEDSGEPMDLFCSICDAYVQERSKHCGTCNRCCEEFDHHCRWLNNCIGTENYANFRFLIKAYLVFCLASQLLSAQALGKSAVNDTPAILLWV